MTTRPPARPGERSGPDLATELRHWDDERLADLLATRPDLGTPAPSSITALATRALSRPSVGRALGRLDRPTLTVAEALAVSADAQSPTSASTLSAALGFDTSDAVGTLLDRALACGCPEQLYAVAAVSEAIGTHPLGLGPSLAALDTDPRGWPTTTSAARSVMAGAPPGAERMLAALLWGPPVGTVSADLPPAATWLVQSRILHPLSATQLVLPREVGLALRAGRLARDVPTQPPLAGAEQRAEPTVAAESTRAAEDLLHQIAMLLTHWGSEPPAVLRSGGVGVRELRATAAALEVPTAQVALVVETAGMLGLIGHHHTDGGSRWAPTTTAQDWAAEPLADRWVQVVQEWLASPRTPWLVGTRTDKGTLRSALDPDLQRSWAPELRARLLGALAAWDPGEAPDAGALVEYLRWHSPRAAPPADTVTAMLGEFAGVGLLGAGALSASGRALAAGAGPAELQATFSADLPDEVSEFFIQGDLTGIVPGRPSADLAALLADVAEIEGRGAATTVRFTTESIRRALDAGGQAQEVLDRLRQYSVTGVPQPLEYLITDTARTHGRIRVARAGAVLHGSEDGALTALVSDPRLAHLRLRLIAPTVLLAGVEATEVLEALRHTGHSAALEGPDGQLITLATRTARAARPMPPPAVATSLTQDPAARQELVAQMRAGEDRARTLRAQNPGGADDPVHALETLRAAAGSGTSVDLVLAGVNGQPETRLVRPLSVAGGRVRVLDVDREAEITIAPHRIASVRVRQGG
ncbi:MAG TPA: helicase-associated domain-containing protein [Beutenbergiaceae bacterium]|nr:helicase-associated domain-containing protein [Beutenbergiaceae bacterium]